MIAELEPCGIRIDENGDWFYDGSKIFRPGILETLYEKLELLPTGEYVLADQRGRCLLEVADTPFVVTRVDLERDTSGGERIVIALKNISRFEALDPRTLQAGKDNVLYCRTDGGRFPARFSRPAYYQLAEFVGEDESGRGFFIELAGERYPIKMDGGS
ncbi:MAG: DUF1285 domain-containing protein [Syntrophobacteraceae bacterium]|nr:DUF1285 domain-containing protein [Syntrophobacteraceae bacterium]